MLTWLDLDALRSTGAARRRTVGRVLAVAGAAAAAYSLGATSWYGILSRNALPLHLTASEAAFYGTGAYDDAQSQRWWPLWVLFGLSVLGTLVAVLATPRLPRAARWIAPLLVVLPIVLSVALVIDPRIEPRGDLQMAPMSNITIHPAFWLAIAGFALIGVGSAVALGRAKDPHQAAR